MEKAWSTPAKAMLAELGIEKLTPRGAVRGSGLIAGAVKHTPKTFQEWTGGASRAHRISGGGTSFIANTFADKR